ncbi:MAG: hypothetical protein COY09_03245 [Candidatus Portnoybacteria bacterium CG_4_10_14_0_2_um_filter_39_11]|uniref:ComEC/Rec2-related protein domain-containing protein n=1 Tax=Candidatus Portnoybacteria bacterium CG_4_10_14_0_2_um_filter_39_11 TaxID=1974797 RepID=A0A2M7UGH3_9BACT|nr:MAG: hypothetical protein COY09_03245 [Candidatus Portnoybacteria bacterium CG_4_10_14_0_2_um_filter_39_11]
MAWSCTVWCVARRDRRKIGFTRISARKNFGSISVIHQSTFFLYFWLSFLGGVFIGLLTKLRQPWWLVFLVAGLALFCVFWRRNYKLMFVGICLIGLGFGWWRLASSQEIDLNKHLSRLNNGPKTIITGFVASEPEISKDSKQFILQAQSPLAGKILVTTEKYQKLNYGDKMQLTGKLKAPENFSNFDWISYLARDQIYTTMYQPEISLNLHQGGGVLVGGYRQILNLKSKIKNALRQSLPQPQSGLLVALLLGDEEYLSTSLKDKLNLTSTRHIIAISGSNIVLLSQIFFTIFLYLGFWRGQIFYLNSATLGVFILMIGAPGSAVRAAVMAWFLMLAQKVGRLSSIDRAMVFGACLIVLIKPMALRFDVGFQLSFVAVLGLVYIKPWLDQLFKVGPAKIYWRELLTMTLAAQIATLPLAIYYFGQLSAVGVIANLLVVPITPFLLAGILILLPIGFVWLGLAKILAVPLWLGASYILMMVDFFSRSWWPVWHLTKISWLWLVVYYIILIGVLRWQRYRHAESVSTAMSC